MNPDLNAAVPDLPKPVPSQPHRKHAEDVTMDEAKEALLRSGYLLESRLETALRRRGFYVEANVACPDRETAKPREFDVYAMNTVRAGKEEFDFIFEVLLVECINNSQPVAFITKSPQVGFLHSSEVKLAGLPVKVPDEARPGAWLSLPDFLHMEKYHHYCKGRIATQFCSFVRKKGAGEWMATHEDAHFDALQKLSAVTEYMMGKHFTGWVLADRADETLNIEFYYPVVVLQGRMLEARAERRALALHEANHVQFRRSAIVGLEEVHYQIDVVTERFFPRFLRILETEMSTTARLLKRRQAQIQAAIDRIWRSARRLRSAEKIRAALEC